MYEYKIVNIVLLRYIFLPGIYLNASFIRDLICMVFLTHWKSREFFCTRYGSVIARGCVNITDKSRDNRLHVYRSTRPTRI